MRKPLQVMCGIAGILDLTGQRRVPRGVARRMADALIHRGPDEDGYYENSGIALASRRLSIVGLSDGQQPVTNEDKSVVAVFNGELFDHIEQRAMLEARGHTLLKSCDTEIIPYLWEDHGEGVFEKLRGQFAIALWDAARSRLLLGRDRFGIAPLYWTKQGDWLVGYPWYKIAKILGAFDSIPSLNLSDPLRRAFLRLQNVPQFSKQRRRRMEDAIGGPNAWLDAYGILGISMLRFYADPMREVFDQAEPWTGLGMPLERAAKWHPLNRGVWAASRVTLAGHLLQAKGDRVAMHSSVEVRYPFLDEAVFDFTAKLHPRWKLRGFHDKHLLRLLGERWLPPSVVKRKKVIFRAPLDSFHMRQEPVFIRELLSEESLRRTGYFDIKQVRHWRSQFRKMRKGSLPRLSVEMGLVAVVATQLWHHLYIDASLADVPTTLKPPALGSGRS